MNEDGIKTRTTRFEGRGHIDVTIESIRDLEDHTVPEACRIHIEWRDQDNGFKTPDDTIWLDDISDLEVLYDAIGAYLDMMTAEQKRKGGDHVTD